MSYTPKIYVSKKRDRSDSGVIGYVKKKERSEKQDSLYTPEITVSIKHEAIEVDKDLKHYSEQNFTIPSRIPEKVYTVCKGHTAAVNSLQWHPIYGHLLASSSLDKTVKVWSLFPHKGEVLSITHKEAVKDVKWNCDATNLLSGGLDNYVNVIDIETGSCIHSYKHTEWVTSVRPHPLHPSIFLSGGNSKGIVCWDTRTSKSSTEYFGSFGEVQDMEFLNDDGTCFLSSGEIIKRNSVDQGLIAWDWRTGARLSNQIYVEGYTCTCVKRHPTESFFVAQSTADYIALFEATKPYRLNRRKRYQGHKVGGYKIGCSFSKDGHYIASGSSFGSLFFFDYHSSHIVRSMKVFDKSACLTAEYHPHRASTVAISSWSGKIAVLEYPCLSNMFKANITK